MKEMKREREVESLEPLDLVSQVHLLVAPKYTSKLLLQCNILGISRHKTRYFPAFILFMSDFEKFL